ncbi:MAG: hypothetical protein IJ301_01485 [Clostridia bacterium]|nr:hypothetical protein [Clostridia bacterium]
MIKIDRTSIEIKGTEEDVAVEFFILMKKFVEIHLFDTLRKVARVQHLDCIAQIEAGAKKLLQAYEQKNLKNDYQRIDMRISDTSENLEKFDKFLNMLERSDLIKIINSSRNYKNRNSKIERKYLTIEFKEIKKND